MHAAAHVRTSLTRSFCLRSIRKVLPMDVVDSGSAAGPKLALTDLQTHALVHAADIESLVVHMPDAQRRSALGSMPAANACRHLQYPTPLPSEISRAADLRVHALVYRLQVLAVLCAQPIACRRSFAAWPETV
jgi:hypothetical protein